MYLSCDIIHYPKWRVYYLKELTLICFWSFHDVKIPINLLLWPISTFLRNNLTATYGFYKLLFHPKLQSKLLLRLLSICIQLCTHPTSLNLQFSSFRKNHDKTRKPFSSRIIQLQTHFPSSSLIQIPWNLYPNWSKLSVESKYPIITKFWSIQKQIRPENHNQSLQTWNSYINLCFMLLFLIFHSNNNNTNL